MPKIVNLIYSNEKTIGDGSAGNPIRKVHGLYTFEGEMVVEYDFYGGSKYGIIEKL